MSEELLEKGVITHNLQKYQRYAIKTHFVNRGESYIDLLKQYVEPHYEAGDILFISEKIISICQNRVIEKSSLKPGFWAKTLSKFVMKTTAGFSVGNVYKMQLAIKLAGLPRILLAAGCSAITKPFGIRGVFYRVAGHDINGIDGFYGGAFQEYAELGILNPDKPNEVSEEIATELHINGLIVDSNDLGCNLLGKSKHCHLSEEDVKVLLKGNPAGQDNQCTPFILLKPVK